MHAPNSYDYALIRLVPSVERGECLNIGVILFCRTLAYLGVRIYLDKARSLALSPDLDLAAVQRAVFAGAGGPSRVTARADRSARGSAPRHRPFGAVNV